MHKFSGSYRQMADFIANDRKTSNLFKATRNFGTIT